MVRTIAFASGKGGVGKTSISVNCAITLVKMGYKVALLDADFGMANSHIMMDQKGIVCDDADLDLAVPAIVAGAMGATGQKCTATRRIIATPGIRDELTDRLISAVSALQVGDGMHAGIGIGPLVSPGARAEVAEAYDAAVAEGAEILAAAEAPAGDCFFAPTLFAGSPDLSLGRDEVFGPLSLVIAADSDDEAFAMANDTEFGLSASVFTNDLWRIDRALHELQAGVIKINAPTTGTELHAPFGGDNLMKLKY